MTWHTVYEPWRGTMKMRGRHIPNYTLDAGACCEVFRSEVPSYSRRGTSSYYRWTLKYLPGSMRCSKERAFRKWGSSTLPLPLAWESRRMFPTRWQCRAENDHIYEICVSCVWAISTNYDSWYFYTPNFTYTIRGFFFILHSSFKVLKIHFYSHYRYPTTIYTVAFNDRIYDVVIIQPSLQHTQDILYASMFIDQSF